MHPRAQIASAPDEPVSSDPGLVFSDALRRHQQGDFAGAAARYREVLALDPRHAESLHMLGVIATREARYDEAAALIGQALSLTPNSARAHVSLGDALHKAGRDADALAEHDRALELTASHADALWGRALAMHKLGRLDEAMEGYRQVLALRPTFAEAANNLGNALSTAGRDGEAAAAFERAISIRPDYADAHYNLGVVLLKQERDDEAAKAYQRALALAAEHEMAMVNLGIVLRRLGRTDEAVRLYRRALALKPDRAITFANLANALEELGESAEARTAAERAVELDASSVEAWAACADLKTFTPGDPDLDQMERLYGSLDSPDMRMELGFALGKAWMDAGDPDRAFSRLEPANRRRRASLAYDLQADLNRFAGVQQVFTPERLSQFAGHGDASDLPVFVVGMPRSGTTLVEQILGSHPDVQAAGELMALATAIAETRGGQSAAPDAPGSALRRLAEAYLSRVRPLAQGKRRLIDKLPANFENAGLISLALPNARIIHCRRDPVDTCLSCYATKFIFGQAFTYDLGELGGYYRGYARLMEHWRAHLPPDRFLEVRYEDVVNDLEGQARRLVAFLGLDWDEACLTFHQMRRPVRTASVSQVRRPLYQGSVGRWRPYARHLAPLLAALGDLVPPDSEVALK
jgi:tetratricopeptide (TPR) repeat protein